MEQIRAQISLIMHRDPAIHGPPPKIVSQGNLEAVLCMVQDTSVVGYSGTFFDETLWLEIVNFVAEFATIHGALALFIEHAKEPYHTISFHEYFGSYKGLNKTNREPPKLMLVSKDAGMPLLCVEVEFWCRIGGPMPYHDSYTYVFFADPSNKLQIKLIQEFTRRQTSEFLAGGYRNAA